MEKEYALDYCPFCGHADAPQIEILNSSGWVAVRCDSEAGGCGCGTTWVDTILKAAALWNRRHEG